MKIYTKAGDNGDTSLFGGKRVPKSSLRVDVSGTIDELNAVIGNVRSLLPPSLIDTILYEIQNQLFALGAELADPERRGPQKFRISEMEIHQLEKMIDEIESQLSPLESFILPGGSPTAAQLHVARTVCRRAERLMDGIIRKENGSIQLLIFLNRLSDLLFVLARMANKLQGIEETKWPGMSKK